MQREVTMRGGSVQVRWQPLHMKKVKVRPVRGLGITLTFGALLDALLRFTYLLAALIVAGQVLGHQDISSRLFYLSFFTTMALWLLTVKERFDRIDMLATLTVVFALTFTVPNGIFNGCSFSFEYFKKMIMFCTTIVFFAAASKTKVSVSTTRYMQVLYVCIGLLLIWAFLTNRSEMYMLKTGLSNYLVFGFTNPNLVAVFLSCMIMFLVASASFVSASFARRLLNKMVIWAVAAAEFYFLLQTQSRNGLTALIIFAVLYVIGILLRKKEVHLPSALVLVSALGPLVFAGLYLLFYGNGFMMDLFSNFSGAGKGLDSRLAIWERAFRQFFGSPIIGAYYEIGNGTGQSQMHNSHIDVLASYGILVFIPFTLFLCGLIHRLQDRQRGFVSLVLIAGFICALACGNGEATIFSGGLGGYIFAGAFLLDFEFPGKEPGKS